MHLFDRSHPAPGTRRDILFFRGRGEGGGGVVGVASCACFFVFLRFGSVSAVVARRLYFTPFSPGGRGLSRRRGGGGFD